jgi:hypothetical protein
MKILKNWLAPFCCLVIVVYYLGYDYGRNDHAQIVGYAKYLADHTLYATDNYIQGMAQHSINERYVFAKLLSFFEGVLPSFCWLGFCLCTLFLFRLMARYGRIFIRTEYVVWLALLVLFIPLYGINLGGNEILYNSFFVSSPVKMLAMAGILLLIHGRLIWAQIIFGLCTLLQPVVGSGLFVVACTVPLIGYVSGMYRFSREAYITGITFYLLTGGLWIFLLKFLFEDNGVDNTMFFDILFMTRAPHHYLPSAYPASHYAVLVPLHIFGAWYYFYRHKVVFGFYLTVLIGVIVYVVGVEGYQMVNVASLQWFKTTIWLEFFSVVAVAAYIDARFSAWYSRWFNDVFRYIFSVGSIVLMWVMLFEPSVLAGRGVPYDFPNRVPTDAEADIAMLAKEHTPKDALFVQPFDFTELKVYGERSSFVEWKILVHRKKNMLEWWRRIERVYGIPLGDGKIGNNIKYAANAFYFEQREAFFEQLAREEGVTHLLTLRSHQLDFRVVASNGVYVVYALK